VELELTGLTRIEKPFLLMIVDRRWRWDGFEARRSASPFPATASSPMHLKGFVKKNFAHRRSR
jgi:hypothetical protein